MLLGLKGASLTFQQMRNNSAAYIIFSEDWDERLEHVRLVLQKLREAGLTVNTKTLVKEDVFIWDMLLDKGR